jgi:hypothetical protein
MLLIDLGEPARTAFFTGNTQRVFKLARLLPGLPVREARPAGDDDGRYRRRGRFDRDWQTPDFGHAGRQVVAAICWLLGSRNWSAGILVFFARATDF